MQTKTLAFAVALFFIWSSLGQTVPSRYLNSEQIDSLLASIADRSKNLPNNESQVIYDLHWIDDGLGSVSASHTRNREQAPSKRVAQFKQLLPEFEANARELKTEDAEKLKQFLEDQYLPVLSAVESAVFFLPDDESLKSWTSLQSLISKPPLKKLIKQGEIVSPPPQETSNVVFAIKQQVVPGVQAVLKDLEDQAKTQESTRQQLATKLDKAQTELQTYRQKLLEQRQRAETKQSLKSNLYLMILVIGGLSVLAIAVVRWFPERVMMEWVESGQVIQFVTVMILLSVIMALGLGGLLTENTLGTLLGGIGGYVLSQGIGRSAARAATRGLNQNRTDAIGERAAKASV